jgi:hypothetical protein
MFKRVPVALSERPGDAGIRIRYPIEEAKWIWAPGVSENERSFVHFSLTFSLEDRETLEFEVSADQRFVLRCDSHEVGRGPDRSELSGWSFHRYQAVLEKGTHQLEALCHWLPIADAPLAQVSVKPAFALKGIGTADERLSTGIAPWRAVKDSRWHIYPRSKEHGYHVIGAGFDLHGTHQAKQFLEPVAVHRGYDDSTGVVHLPWRCEPSPLPEQERQCFSGGQIRTIQDDHEEMIRTESNHQSSYAGITQGKPVEILSGQRVQILWDLEDYICAYPILSLEGGKDSTIEITWAESLYEDAAAASQPKGNRGDFKEKFWLGFGDLIRHPGGEESYEIPWWRSGKWIRLAIQTQEEPLRILDARPLQTKHPFSREWYFDCDSEITTILPLCEKALINCVHETFVDCPYYEQMQYVGDTRVQALSWLVSCGDSRPVQRALDLFDRSRWVNGFIAERTPTVAPQMSATYSLIQPKLLKDYAMWVDDHEGVKRLLPGSRCAIEHALASLDENDLPTKLPGWLFVDWVDREDWFRGMPLAGVASHRKARTLSAPVALHLPLALEAIAQVEILYGEVCLAQRYQAYAEKILEKIIQVYGDEERGILADDPEHQFWSEHAQALALDCSCLPSKWKQSLLQALIKPEPDLARASIYFSFHIHEALLRAGHVDSYLKRLDFWRDLNDKGLHTTIERPEPSRSDCHGWGSHPLYHILSGLSGIRPADKAFSRTVIEPQFGPLTRICAVVPHPKGAIKVEFSRNGNALTGTIESPVDGDCIWNENNFPIEAGTTRIRC